MRAVIACGGTGGHLFPGLAVAQALEERGHEIMLFVSEKEIDTLALKGHPEFRFEKLPSVGLPTVISPAFIRFIRRSWESLSLCKDIYRKFKPSVVLGMGGFTSTAPILAGRMRKIPTFIHESNAIPGRANKLSARFVSAVLLGFKECAPKFPDSDCVVTGTPVRRNLGVPRPREEALAAFKLDPARPTVLVMGGSQGAQGINQLLFKAAPLLRQTGMQIIHLTGDRDDRLAAANYLREEIPAYVSPFHHSMEEAYSAADLAISRAGAASLSELSQFGLPSILVPYPYATDNHQEANARIFVERGAAEMLLEGQATPDAAAALISNLLSDSGRREQMSLAIREVTPRDAADRVATVLEEAAA